MKKWKLLIIFVAITIFLTACSIQLRKPKEGIWYCDELKISIDFSSYQDQKTPDCAKLFDENGSYTDIRCYFDYGTGVHLVSQDQLTDYLNGKFRYRGNTITVTSYSDGTEYTFVRVDEEPEG